MSPCPKRVTVAGRPWRIKFVNESRMRDLCPDAGVIGLTFGQRLSIYIADWVPPTMQRESVLHELMHACVFGGRFDGNSADDTDMEEHFISGLARPLTTTLRDNPALAAYLTAS